MQQLLTRENIEFYTQRRLQYCEDFMKLTKQFQPKFDLLAKKLIARKQVTYEANKQFSPKLYATKKFSRVLASLSKSKDIQSKIDKEMKKHQCKYQLDELPDCGFNYSQTCHKIQKAMIPLIENLSEQMKEKQSEIMQNQENSHVKQER